MRKQIRILNPSSTVLMFYDRKIDASVSVHLLDEDDIRFLRTQGFVVAYDKPTVKITRTLIIK